MLRRIRVEPCQPVTTASPLPGRDSSLVVCGHCRPRTDEAFTPHRATGEAVMNDIAVDEVRSESEAEPAIDRMLTTSEVAKLFRVSAKTVGRWGRSGSLPLHRTIGGHHRYRLADVRSFLGLDTDAAVTASV